MPMIVMNISCVDVCVCVCVLVCAYVCLYAYDMLRCTWIVCQALSCLMDWSLALLESLFCSSLSLLILVYHYKKRKEKKRKKKVW